MDTNSRYITAIVAVTLFSATCIASAMTLSKMRERDFYSMQGVASEATYEIDKEQYRDAVLFLCSSDRLSKEKLDEAQEKFKDIIDSELLSLLQSKAVATQSTQMENMEMESAYDNSKTPSKQDENYYPIYGNYLTISGYGTKEESEQSIQDFLLKPENTMGESSVYKDTILFRVTNKVSGEKLIRINITDGKISDYKVYMKGGN